MEFNAVAYGIVIFAGIYLLSGLLFCIILFAKGISSFDANANGTGIGFKLVIIPGILVFWPLLWLRWKRKNLS